MSDGNPLPDLSGLLSVAEAQLLKCIDRIHSDLTFSGATGKAIFHFVRFDGNGEVMLKALAEVMYQHAIDYCIAARDRPDPLSTQDAARLTKEARKLFIHPPATDDDPDQTGEAGELLLYLLIEVMLKAPQVVAKMELKTNSNKELHGSDGIHMAWNDQEKLVDIYFGESKIYQDLGAALAAALKSIDGFHANELCSHEFLMVTKQFKYAEPNIRDAVKALLKDGTPTGSVRINHACLIGFNWKDYEAVFKEEPGKRLAALQHQYTLDIDRILKVCDSKLAKFKSKHLVLHIFFLPFENVQAFRDAFNKALD